MNENRLKYDDWLDKLEGKSSRDKNDRGGHTVRGMIQSDADKYCEMKMLPHMEIGEATDAQLDEMRYMIYWVPMGCHLLEAPLDWLMYQWGLLQSGAAPLGLQRVVGVKQDGNIGPLTVKAAEECGLGSVAVSLLNEQVDSLNKVVASSNKRVLKWLTDNPKMKVEDAPFDQRQFALGWVNRCQVAANMCGVDWRPDQAAQAWAVQQTAGFKAKMKPLAVA